MYAAGGKLNSHCMCSSVTDWRLLHSTPYYKWFTQRKCTIVPLLVSFVGFRFCDGCKECDHIALTESSCWVPIGVRWFVEKCLCEISCHGIREWYFICWQSVFNRSIAMTFNIKYHPYHVNVVGILNYKIFLFLIFRILTASMRLSFVGFVLTVTSC